MMSSEQLLNALQDFAQWQEIQFQAMRRKGFSIEEINSFREKCEEVRSRVTAALAGGSNDVRRVAVETLKTTENLFRVINFRAAFKGFSSTKVRPKGASDEDLLSWMNKVKNSAVNAAEHFESYAAFSFGELDGERHEIETLPCGDADVLRRFQQAGNASIFSITGVLLPDLVDGSYKLLLVGLKALQTPLDLIEATPAEIGAADTLIANHGSKSLLKSIFEIVKGQLRILDPGDPAFNEALEVVILQAASHGKLNGENARIHTLVVGPPGHGKSKIAKVAELCEPVTKRVEAQAITEDGLYGNSGSSHGRRVIRVGYIPQSHLGVFAIEDFHQTNALKNARLITSFTYTMETARCEAANASRASYDAQVAFHVDANRTSDVDSRKSSATKLVGLERITADTGLPTNVLTRFDFIAELERDPRRQVELSFTLAGQAVQISDIRLDNESNSSRIVQVALALLRTRIPTIDIDLKVASYLQKRFQSIINVNTQVLNENIQYGDFLTRGVKSFQKLVAAYARTRNRDFATREDVDAVYPYVLRKFETVLQWLVGSAESDLTQSARKQAHMTLLRLKFGGQSVQLDAVRKMVPHVSDKTLKRYMDEICGARNNAGGWTVPPFCSQEEVNETDLQT